MRELLFLSLTFLTMNFVCAEPIRWANGQWDDSGAPRGRLLSDNEGSLCDCVLTGVTYEYRKQPNVPADSAGRDKQTFGRRLLDGQIQGDWLVPVGISRGPVEVVFDFKRPCVFSEVDLFASRTPRHVVTLKISDDRKNWRAVSDVSGESELTRVKLPEGTRGRYLQLGFRNSDPYAVSCLDEILVWGDAVISEKYPEAFRPLNVPPVEKGQFQSLRGIRETLVKKEDFLSYRARLGAAASLPVLWGVSRESTPSAPVMPEANAAVSLSMARNETESIYLTLTNPSPDKAVTLTVEPFSLSGFESELRIGGILPVNRPIRKLTPKEKQDLFISGNVPPDAEPENSMQVLPFFRSGQELPPTLMRRYLANAECILHFPEITLNPAESAVLMLRVRTLDVAPGLYQTVLSARSKAGSAVALPVKIRVVNLTLPQASVWVRAWGPMTGIFPFETQSRIQSDAKLFRELGANVIYGFPEPGSKADFFRKTGKTFFRLKALPKLSRRASEIPPGALSDQDREDIRENIRLLTRQARQYNIPYEEWFVELWDEPGLKNTAIFGEICKVIKETDPQVRIYMNPCFWQPGFPPQQEMADALAPYYNERIDISCPIMDLVKDNLTTRELWTRPRQVNALYLHPARRAGRGISYRSFRYGMNGWGYYCYFAPRGNPWDILTWKALGYAYQMVFPTDSGAVITPIYETMREGVEDYRLLTALRQQKKTDVLSKILSAQNSEKVDYQELRNQALNAY